MKIVHSLAMMVVLVPLGLGGCKGKSQTASADNQYSIKGRVTAVNASKPSVKLDHEDIPGLMNAMEMEFRAESAKVVEGLRPGDQVEGHLKVESGKYIITHLEKR